MIEEENLRLLLEIEENRRDEDRSSADIINLPSAPIRVWISSTVARGFGEGFF